MTELELQQYLLREYPQENARCEWKEFKNLKNSFCGDEKDDVVSYVSAIANMEGGHLVIGVKDKTLEARPTYVGGFVLLHSKIISQILQAMAKMKFYKQLAHSLSCMTKWLNLSQRILTNSKQVYLAIQLL